MTTATTNGEATIEAVENMPAITITREFAATPAQLVKAHTDPDLILKWLGPAGSESVVDYWDARTGGNWRYTHLIEGEEYGFHGCFHTVTEDRLVQTFTFEGFPDSVALETMTFEELGDGRTRLHIQSLFDSYEARDGMLSSGMDIGVNEGYAKLDQLIDAGTL